MPQPVTLKKLKLNNSMKTYKTPRTNTQKRCPFHYRRLECKSRKSRNTWTNRQIWPWNTEWSRAKTNKSFAKKMHWSSQTPSSNNTREDSIHGHHQMVNTKIRLIIFFAAKDGEALYSQQNKTGSLWLRSWTPYCHIQTLIEESRENHQTIQVWPKSNPLWLYSGSEK